MDLKQTVKDLMLIDGLSGYEGEVADYVFKALKPIVDEVEIDRLGNVVAKINGTDKEAPVVMFGAHIDQLGLLVRHIDENGYIYPERLGGVPEKTLQALNVHVRNIDGKIIPGLIGVKSFHAMPPEERLNVIKLYDCYIDVGATSKKEVEDMGITVGCGINYKPYYQELANGRFSGTSIDDRALVAAMLKIAERLSANRPKSDTYFVATTMEEYTLRGCRVPARAIQPDISIYFDVCIAGDTPDLKGIYNVDIGKGPAICMYSNHARGSLLGNIPSKPFVDFARKTAKDKGINLQYFASGGFMTDNVYIQDITNKGTTVLDVCCPTRYTHTAVEMAQLSDLEKVVELSVAMSENIDKDFNLGRY